MILKISCNWKDNYYLKILFSLKLKKNPGEGPWTLPPFALGGFHSIQTPGKPLPKFNSGYATVYKSCK